MKKPEILAPAGNMECLRAAIAAGCDAIYLGGKTFGARSFAGNFTNEELEDAVNFAHEFGVKIYVTTNTLIYENEVSQYMEYVDYLVKINVDAIIIQDLGMYDLVRQTYPDFEIHASTQMHIHNLDGTAMAQKLGLNRVVLARETSIIDIVKIKKETNMELEIFVHGALCISYSGQCLMSSLIGNRSGNRGSCAGSCRLQYDVYDEFNNKLNQDKFNLSTKDLNSLENIGKLIEAGVDSLKIEGRMKSSSYVFLVVKLYREAVDSYFKYGKVVINKEDILNLMKTFNRNFTKGFLFDANNNDIINPNRPNHLGVEIGEVISCDNKFITIKLKDTLNINDGIRFIDKKDSGFIVTSMFKNNNRINSANKGDIIKIPCREKINKSVMVVKTTDFELNKKLKNEIEKITRNVLINGKVYIKDDNLILDISDGINNIIVKSDFKLEIANNNPTTETRIKEQLEKTGSTIYKFEKIEILCDLKYFIPIKILNDLRREALEKLKKVRIEKKVYKKSKYEKVVPNFKNKNEKSCFIKNIEQFKKIKNNFDYVYAENELYSELKKNENVLLKNHRVIKKYNMIEKNAMIGEIGGLLKNLSPHTDFSFNVTNSYTIALLHHLGVEKITMSLELENYQIKEIVDSYEKRYKSHPNLEVIVYGNEEVMVSKFNLLEIGRAHV